MSRQFLGVVVLWVLMGGSMWGKVPRWVYEKDKVDEAMAEAVKRNKGLAFVLTNPEST